MKQFLLLISLLFTSIFYAQCPTGNFADLRTQADVDDFGANFPNCTTLIDLRIGTTAVSTDQITDLSPLSSLTTVQDLLVIENDDLLNLNGLGNITVENLTITQNESLQSISTSQIEVTSQLRILDNPSLVNLEGFEGTTMLQVLEISNNPITSLSGLDNLTTVTFSAAINDNDALLNLSGLGGLTLARGLSVNQNNNLQNLNGVGMLTVDNLGISSNIAMSEISTTTSINVTVNLEVNNNTSLDNFTGLEETTHLQDLRLSNNAITSFTGLNNLVEISDFFRIMQSPNITNFTGLDNLVIIESLEVNNNSSLINLNGLPDASLSFVLISNNPVLQQIATTNTLQVTESLQVVLNDDLNNLQGLETTTSLSNVSISSNTISSLVGLENLTEVTGFLTIASNIILPNLTGLTNLQSVMTLVVEFNEDLINLDGLGSTTIQELAVTDNPSMSSIALTSELEAMQEIEIVDNALLTDLTGLENIVSTSFIGLSGNGITSLNGLQNLESVQNSFIINTNDMLPNLNGLSNLQYVESLTVGLNETMVNLDGVGDIQVAALRLTLSPNVQQPLTQGSIAVTSSIAIEDNPNITNLNGLETTTQVSSISIERNPLLFNINSLENATVVGNVQIIDNAALSNCSIESFCLAIAAGNTNFNIANNATGCNSLQEIEQGCIGVVNSLTGTISFDIDNNGCSTGNAPSEGILVSVENSNGILSTLTDSNGNYVLLLSDNEYTVYINEQSLPSDVSFSPASQTILFTESETEVTADFCLTSSSSFDDLAVSIFPLEEARPGFETDYLINFENNGTTVLNPTITLMFEDTKMNYLSSTPQETSVTSNMVTWSFSNLQPFQSGSIVFTTDIFQPPTVNGDDILNYTVTISPNSNDAIPEDNSQVFEQIVVNSFDPNDKQVTQGESILEAEVPNYLDYLVRFQNTGTASAVNITVTDTLSNNLQWGTLKAVASSHEYRLEVEDGNIVKFIFEDIFLPAEQDNSEGSNGYVAFRIKPVASLTIGESVENTANIFFDFNEPIITNTVTTEVVAPLSVPKTSVPENILLYPNPVNSNLNVETVSGNTVTSIVVTTLTGQRLLTSKNTSINLTSLTKGIYFVTVTTQQGKFIKRIIKD